MFKQTNVQTNNQMKVYASPPPKITLFSFFAATGGTHGVGFRAYTAETDV